MTMEESDNLRQNEIPVQGHPLYVEAMQLISSGDELGALEALEALSESYPDDQALSDFVLRLQLRTAFDSPDYIQVDHAQPRPVLRSMVLLLLAVTGFLVIITGLTAVYTNMVAPTDAEGDLQAEIDAIKRDVASRFDRGDLTGAQAALEQLGNYALAPNDVFVADYSQKLEEQRACAESYARAVELRERGSWQEALDLATQISPECLKYRESRVLAEDLRELASLETAWQAAEAYLADEDWEQALEELAWLRAEAPEFRRAQVEQRLYQVHSMLAFDLLGRANGRTETLREALVHLGAALRLRPTDRTLIVEKSLAEGFIAGSEAYDRGDWVAVIDAWEPVFEERPDYQGSVLSRRLEEAYPLAAEQTIAGARGSAIQLNQAIVYIDQALAYQPDSEELRQERELISGYLSGLDAFKEESWNLAISYWASIYVLRPGYQDGILEEELRVACANSTKTDDRCPP
jgi:tetratricopeptide (TPR) repeat protein